MNENYEIGMGEIVSLSSGEYSDYCVNGTFISQKSFNLSSAKDTFKVFVNENKKDFCYSDIQEQFLTWLVANEYLMPLDTREIHLGTYGEICDESIWVFAEEDEE